MGVELRHFRYLAAVAEARSVTAAARELHISQPALTNAIKQLEGLVGVELLERRATGVELTASGVALLDRALASLSAADDAVTAARRGAGARARPPRGGAGQHAHGRIAPRDDERRRARGPRGVLAPRAARRDPLPRAELRHPHH